MDTHEEAVLAATRTLLAAGYQLGEWHVDRRGDVAKILKEGVTVGWFWAPKYWIGIEVGLSLCDTGRGWLKINAKGEDAALFGALAAALAPYAQDGQE